MNTLGRFLFTLSMVRSTLEVRYLRERKCYENAIESNAWEGHYPGTNSSRVDLAIQSSQRVSERW